MLFFKVLKSFYLMKFNISIHKVTSLVLILGILGTLAFSSCRKTRYRKMVKKRRAGTMKKSRHKGTYQKKLRKETLSVESPYFIKRKKNYRRRPWYN
jgi:cytochrome b subunit of formate dehydrogenase